MNVRATSAQIGEVAMHQVCVCVCVWTCVWLCVYVCLSISSSTVVYTYICYVTIVNDVLYLQTQRYNQLELDQDLMRRLNPLPATLEKQSSAVNVSKSSESHCQEFDDSIVRAVVLLILCVYKCVDILCRMSCVLRSLLISVRCIVVCILIMCW